MAEKKETKLPCLFHWVNVNSTWDDRMIFTTTEFKMDHGLEYAHFERLKSITVENNLCGWGLN